MLRVEDAEYHGQIAQKVNILRMLIARATKMREEGWLVTKIQLSAPEEGASDPAGTMLDLLPPGMVADVSTSDTAAKIAIDMYQSQLNELMKTLDNM